MSFDDQFTVVDDAVAPAPWMQLRMVSTTESAGVSKSYDVSDGWAKNQLVQSLDAAWTNNSPVSQWVYGLATKAGTQVTLQCRSRGYLETSHGIRIDPADPDPDPDEILMTEVSRFGIGSDLGAGGLLATGGMYAISEMRQNSTTMPLMPHITGWFLLAPGETFNARIEVRFVSTYWENTQIDGGDGNTQSMFIAGEFRLDLFALPSAQPKVPRPVPAIVGGTDNVTHDVAFFNGLGGGTVTKPAVPAGVEPGDTLLAVVANQFGLDTDITARQSGWTRLHNRDGGWEDVHLKVYARVATDDEPTHYSFTNGLLAEETAVIVALRGTAPFGTVDDDPQFNWYIASNLTKPLLFGEEHKMPSVNRSGQMLIGVSYFQHTALQGPIHQTSPTGMTKMVDVVGGNSSMALAYLNSPPNPTLVRRFTLNKQPILAGHSICVAIVVPGQQT